MCDRTYPRRPVSLRARMTVKRFNAQRSTVHAPLTVEAVDAWLDEQYQGMGVPTPRELLALRVSADPASSWPMVLRGNSGR